MLRNRNEYLRFSIFFARKIVSLRKNNKSMENLLERITVNPQVCFGKPTVRNMRYPVQMLLELLSSGMSIEEILVDYPDLEREDILACLLFAARLIQIKNIESLSNLAA